MPGDSLAARVRYTVNGRTIDEVLRPPDTVNRIPYHGPRDDLREPSRPHLRFQHRRRRRQARRPPPDPRLRGVLLAAGSELGPFPSRSTRCSRGASTVHRAGLRADRRRGKALARDLRQQRHDAPTMERSGRPPTPPAGRAASTTASTSTSGNRADGGPLLGRPALLQQPVPLDRRPGLPALNDSTFDPNIGSTGTGSG